MPRFYLRGFSEGEEGNLEQYSLLEDKSVSVNIKCAGAKNYLYSIIKKDSSKDDELENLFAEFDNDMAKALTKVTKNSGSLSSDDRVWLKSFLVLQHLRTPKIIGHTRNLIKSEWEKKFKELNRARNNKMVVFPKDTLENKSYKTLEKIVNSPNYIFSGLMQLYGVIFLAIEGWNWKLLEAPRNSQFVTSDAPVSNIIIGRNSIVSAPWEIGHPESEIALPLSSTFCLTAKSRGGSTFKHVKVRKNVVKFINLRTIESANNFIYYKRMTPDIEDVFMVYKERKLHGQTGIINTN